MVTRILDVLRKFLEDVVAKLLATLVVALLTGLAGYLYGVTRERSSYEQRVRAAPQEYVALLKAQIEKGKLAEAQDVRIYARSIVAVRNEQQKSLSSLSQHLNGEIDRLAQLVQTYEASPTKELEREMTVTIRVLSERWPAKEKLIEYELRKVLAELGLDRIEP